MKIKAIVITVFFGFIVFADADTLTLKDYVKIALKNNPQQAIATGTVDASAAAVSTAHAKLLPQVSASGGLLRSSGAGSSIPLAGPAIRPLPA